MKKTTIATQSGLLLLFCLFCQAFFTNKVSAQSSCKAKFSYTTKDSIAYFIPDSVQQPNKVYTWSFGVYTYSNQRFQSKPVFTYKYPGKYNVCLWVRDTITNCKDSFCTTVDVSFCKANFSYYRRNIEITFYNASFYSKNAVYFWDFGDSSTSSLENPVHIYKKGGTYKVTFVKRDTVLKCTDTSRGIVNPVDLINSCKIGFKAKVEGYKVTISDTNPMNETGNRYISINNNTSRLYGSEGSYYFNQNGKYKVTFVKNDSFINCTDTFRTEIEIKVCKADFYFQKSGNTYNFTNASSYPNASFHWDFGDGTTSTDANPQHKYKYLGNYNVKLIMTNSAENCIDSMQKNIIVTCNTDFAQFGYKVDGKKVSFYDSSILLRGGTYFWRFYYPSNYLYYPNTVHNSTAKNPEVYYMKGGRFYVVLHLKDSLTGCQDSIAKYIDVPECEAYFYTTQDYETMNFVNRSTDTINSSFFWDFGDGATSTAVSPKHRYDKAYNTYIATLIMRSKTTNCMDSTVQYVVPYPGTCYNDFVHTVSGNVATFTADTLYYEYYYKKATFSWNFGDSTTSLLRNPKHTYKDTGTYKVCLTITNAYCTSTKCIEVKIKSLSPTYSISGKVYNGSSLADTSGIDAYLIKFSPQDSSLSVVDTFRFDFSRKNLPAEYLFHNLMPGKYFVKAALNKGSLQYANYLPTYADTSLRWENAREIVITNSNVTSNIHLRAGNNPGGKGFISGKVSQGANKREGDPLVNVLVTLLDENLNAVTYTYSDSNGIFSFSNIPLGKFLVYTEVVGVKTIPAWVTLTEDNPKEDKVEVAIRKKVIITSIRGDDEMPVDAKITVYPNPVKDQLTVAIDAPVSRAAKLIIYDYTGRKIISEQILPSAGAQTININTTQLPAGVYLMQIQLNNELVRQFKFVK